MEEEMLARLADNATVVVVMGIWLIVEMRAHRETLNYYRDRVNGKLDEIQDSIDKLIRPD